jgi:hypothetical protein
VAFAVPKTTTKAKNQQNADPVTYTTL